MTTLEHDRTGLLSPIGVYVQLISSSRHLEIRPSNLRAHLKLLMRHSHLKPQGYQLQLLSRLFFSFLDDNKDGRISVSDVSIFEKRILFWLAPTKNQDMFSVEQCSRKRFYSLASPGASLNYERLYTHFQERAPKYLPFRKLVASLLSLQLLDLVSSQQSIPTRDRIIDEHSWTQFALSLSLSI